jgi:O-antigen/teichoic acid export membrane protein
VLILGGTGARMVSALIYFLLLVNILSLSDYGLFVSMVATALMIGNSGTYGFLAPAFRAQTERSKQAREYVGALIQYMIAWVPITIVIGLLLHVLLFHEYVGLETFIAIVVAEAILIRVIDSVYNLNIANGRYAAAAFVNLFSILPRVIAVLLFFFAVDQSLANWVNYYFVGSVAALLLALCLFPPIRPVFSWTVLRLGLREAFSLEAVNFIQSVQMELDKVLVLLLSGPAAAGIFGLSMRIIYVVNEPIRSLFPLIAKFFIGDPAKITSMRNQILFEAGLISSSFVAYGGLITILSIRPDLLGANVEQGFRFFALLPLVFALKLLPEYHKTVLYGMKRLDRAAVIALFLTITKCTSIALIAGKLPFEAGWIVPLNLLYVVIYVQSLSQTWTWGVGRGATRRMTQN